MLHQREQHLQELFSTSRGSVLTLAKDDGRYVQFLEGFISQGFLQLMEPSVTLFARKQDVSLVEEAAASAAQTYKEISGREVKYSIEGSLGGDG